MKKINLLAATILLTSIILSAQPDTSIRNFPDRYKLDLPKEWNKPKLIDAITEIAPKVFNEYIDSNKQFCINCTAGLTIMLVIDKPLFKYEERTYQFKATLGLFDTAGKEIKEQLLVSPQEVFQMGAGANYSPPPMPVNNDVIWNASTDRYGNVINVVKIPLSPPPIINNIPTFSTIYPGLDGLIIIAEQRLYTLRKVLAN